MRADSGGIPFCYSSFLLDAWKADVIAGVPATTCDHMATAKMKASAKDGVAEK